ncbi:cytochrome P450 [Talaromyces proteolyticus]|uniref:Cytochrome P450 n=1 Tax=Talaromyces proteolyticus TaxID=1131652 RepID=A0AAD4PTS0_9EURO|nr:cytochrome P450 [Talaromyces proteolyticus]KAH8689149.1 cytochrome P450 [Talaromyces proteolyticus]
MAQLFHTVVADFISWTQILWLVLGLAITRLSWEFLFSPLKEFPGPFAARFTNIWRVLATLRGHVDFVHIQLHRKYGSAVRIGPNVISLGDPKLIKTIYTTNDPWKKSDMYHPNDVLLNGARISNLFNTADENWHMNQIRPIQNLWSMTKVLEYESLIDETLEKFVNKLATKFVTGSNLGRPCAIDEWLAYFAWDVTANVSFGRHYGFIDQEKDVDNLISDSTKGLKYFAPVSQMPWIDHFLDKNPIIRIGPKPTLTGVLYAFGVVAEYGKDLAARQTGERSMKHTLHKYMQLRETHPEIDDAQIVNWLMLSILAGGDTSSAVMRAVIYYLAKSPVAYGKLTQELNEAKLTLPAQWKEIQKLPYLDAVIRESMRLNPGIAMVFERVVPGSGFNLPDGRYIPAGTKVGINPAVTNRDYAVFGKDADSFNPGRWLQGSDESQETFHARQRQMKDVCDFTFGGGRRICMGRHLATLEIYKLIATLYSLYDIKLVDQDHEWKYLNAWFVYQHDIPVTITRRNFIS